MLSVSTHTDIYVITLRTTVIKSFVLYFAPTSYLLFCVNDLHNINDVRCFDPVNNLHNINDVRCFGPVNNLHNINDVRCFGPVKQSG